MTDAETVPAVLRAAADGWPDRPAVTDDETTWTFAELSARSHLAARALQARGVRPGDRVALWGGNSRWWVAASLGAHLAGAAVVGVNHRYTAREAGVVIARATPRLLLADAGADGRDRCAEASASGVPVLPLDRVTCCEPGDAEFDEVAIAPDDVSHVQFTSGTTGVPKGALLRHGGVVATTRSWVAEVGVRPGDRYPVVAPFSHLAGSKTGIVVGLVSGATIRPMPAADAGTLADLVRDWRPTLLQAAPVVFTGLLRSGVDCRSVRVAVMGAAHVPAELLRAAVDELGVGRVVNAYGISEASGVCTMTRAGDPDAAVRDTCGAPIQGTEIRIAGDPPVGEAGEVLVRGPGLMTGYLDDPAASAEALADGWLRTGDVGRLDDAGRLRIVDRLKDLVIVGGLNVYPAEVEQVLVQHPAVSEVAVVGVPDERLGEVPAAAVVPVGDLDVDAVVAWCRERLAGFKTPRTIVAVPALPVSVGGKTLKNEVRAMLEARR